MNKLLFFVFVCIVIPSCNIGTLGPNEVSEQILITNNQGEIIGGNTSDWRVINPIPGFKLLAPPFSNPIQGNGYWLAYSSSQRVNIYLRYHSGEVTPTFSIPGADSIRHRVTNNFGFKNTVKVVDIMINDILFTSGHIQFGN